MATSSYKTYLKYKNGEAYEVLCPIRSFPDIGGAPESLDTTTLSDASKTSVNGIQSQEALEFECNYEKADYDKCKALEGKQTDFKIEFGEDGELGAWEFTGDLSVWAKGAGVNEVRLMTISIAPSTILNPVA